MSVLTKRGIQNAAAIMAVSITSTAWEYTIYDAITGASRKRFKALDKANAKLAYWWDKDGDTPTYWHHGTIRDAIKEADGLLYIAAGEPDFLTLGS